MFNWRRRWRGWRSGSPAQRERRVAGPRVPGLQRLCAMPIRGRIPAARGRRNGPFAGRAGPLCRVPKKSPGAAQLQVYLGKLESVVGALEGRQPFLRRNPDFSFLFRRQTAGSNSYARRVPTRPRNWCSWASPKRSRALDEHDGGVGNVYAHFHYPLWSPGRQRAAVAELPEDSVLVPRRHPPVEQAPPAGRGTPAQTAARIPRWRLWPLCWPIRQ